MVDINGNLHSLSKLQVWFINMENNHDDKIFIHIKCFFINRWGWWCWLDGQRSWDPGGWTSCSTNFILPAWTSASGRSSTSTSLGRKCICGDTKTQRVSRSYYLEILTNWKYVHLKLKKSRKSPSLTNWRTACAAAELNPQVRLKNNPWNYGCDLSWMTVTTFET